MLIITIILMDLLVGMEFDLFVPSLTQIQHHFDTSPFLLEGLISFNFTGYCLGLFIVGEVDQRVGRKKTILLGLVTFVVGSALCLSTISFHTILFGRFLQGLGISAPGILSFILIADKYPIKKQQFYMGILNGTMNIAVAVAPVIGSFIALYFKWRGNFAVLLILGIVALLMTVVFVPHYQSHTDKNTKSFIGYKRILTNRHLMMVIVFFIFNFVPYWIFVGISPLLYVKHLKVGLAYFGYYQGAIALTFGLGSICFGFFVKRFQERSALKFGNAIFILSIIAILITGLNEIQNPLWITLAVMIFVMGQIIPSIILYPLCINIIPREKARISGLMQAGRLVFASLSLELAGFFYDGTFQTVGIIMIVFIFMTVISLGLVIKTWGSIRYASKS